MTNINLLEERMNFLESRVQALGIPLDRWLSPNDTATLLGTTRSQIMKEVRAAEYARINDQPCDLKYAKHYRRQGNNWQISDLEYKKAVLDTPEENRQVVAVPKDFKL